MNRILLITQAKSDISTLIQKSCSSVSLISPDSHYFDASEYDSLCILGGDTESGLVLNPSLRGCVERFRALGRPVFCEFVQSISGAYSNGLLHTTHHRMIFDSRALSVPGLVSGDLLDGHENDCIKYVHIPSDSYPILTYHDYACAHSHIEITDEEYKKGVCAMWREDNLIVFAARLCNFRRSRLAPRHRFEALVGTIIRFLAGEDIGISFEPPICRYESHTVKEASDVDRAVERGIAWFDRAGMLIDCGKGGVQEGFSHRISARDGTQRRLKQIRTDCVGEVAGAFMLKGQLSGDRHALSVGESMLDFIFDCMQVEDGHGKGMLRWTELAWDVCYGDDVARAVIGALLLQHVVGKVPHLDSISRALDFLVDTTDPDGIRVARTTLSRLDSAKLKEITASGAGTPCAHYNAYYHAALLLAYRAGGDRRYLEISERGLRHLMTLYPDTKREQSETEEVCRLLFPLAVLYEITGSEEHYEWLDRVASWLDAHRHECGAVTEWDTGYKAVCSRNNAGECSLLAENGDPVVDLLYSNNWLPLGYAYAYLATREERFHRAWCDIASFLISCQIHSDDQLLDGAWTRAFDVELCESYGVPHDVGWAPCCIETGWTVGEILMGLQFMKHAEAAKPPKA